MQRQKGKGSWGCRLHGLSCATIAHRAYGQDMKYALAARVVPSLYDAPGSQHYCGCRHGSLSPARAGYWEVAASALAEVGAL